ncbi:hypothetical protein [Eubacterium pyruvativorans]|uniref:hypothetical protein n=1 Tax=Eubacterium pyruvativorans TaxID=155865 RepID=UPI0015A58DA4|nr:hypothetical protein [Eubacterium pyruvativorans]
MPAADGIFCEKLDGAKPHQASLFYAKVVKYRVVILLLCTYATDGIWSSKTSDFTTFSTTFKYRDVQSYAGLCEITRIFQGIEDIGENGITPHNFAQRSIV